MYSNIWSESKYEFNYDSSKWKNDGITFKGDGKLVGYGNNTYTYDMNGLRVSKITSCQSTKYYYQGNKLLGEDLPNG